LTTGLAACWRPCHTITNDAVVELALSVIHSIKDTDLRLQSVRLIILAWGDCHFKNPAVEVHTGYSLQQSLAGKEAFVVQVLKEVRQIFPSGEGRLDTETSRLLAMLEDDDSGLPEKIASLWTPASSPSEDMHYLIVLSRLRANWDPRLRRRVVHTLL